MNAEMFFVIVAVIFLNVFVIAVNLVILLKEGR